MKRVILVVSDVTIKTLYLHARMNGLNWTDQFSNTAIAINDEIDSMYRPTTSELNIPVIDSFIQHPMQAVSENISLNMFTKTYQMDT